MTAQLEQELGNLKQGEHICSIYENRNQLLAVSVPFIIEGLARAERCIYIVDDTPIEEVIGALAAAGVDVERERRRGALRLPARQDTYLSTGEFVAQAMVDFIRQAEAEALADGFSGLRLTGEMTWALGSEPGCDQLIEYEAFLDEWLSNSKTVALCHYNRLRFDAPCIHDVVRTHPLVVLGDQLCPNPYHEAPEIVMKQGQPGTTAESKAKRVDWWIAQLKRARAAEQAREQALEQLKQSERRFAEAQQVAHIGSWERNLRTNAVTWSDELYRLFGLSSGAGDFSYQQFLDLVLPEDAQRVRMLTEETIRVRGHFDCDYRIALPDGRIRVFNDRGSVVMNQEGEPVRLVGTAQDVTELRHAEQAREEYAARLKALSHRMLEVQEEQRRHLARELHDEVGQLLTGLRLLLQPNGGPQSEAGSKLDRARAIVDNLLEKVRGLSFDLRPAVLDLFGFLPAVLELFENYTKQTGVLVSFKHKDVERRFPAQVETTAYRIVQEALTNVARHAGVAGATVRTWATEDLLTVQIEDRGRGFDPEKVLAAAQSIGLAGMRERVMLLNGQLTIDSRPGDGTQVTAELPLGSSNGEDKK